MWVREAVLCHGKRLHRDFTHFTERRQVWYLARGTVFPSSTEEATAFRTSSKRGLRSCAQEQMRNDSCRGPALPARSGCIHMFAGGGRAEAGMGGMYVDGKRSSAPHPFPGAERSNYGSRVRREGVGEWMSEWSSHLICLCRGHKTVCHDSFPATTLPTPAAAMLGKQKTEVIQRGRKNKV